MGGTRSMSTYSFQPEGHATAPATGAGAETVSPVRHAPAPGVLRITLGALLCLPGALVIGLGLFLCIPGFVLLVSGMTRSVSYFQRRAFNVRDSRTSITWPMKEEGNA